MELKIKKKYDMGVAMAKVFVLARETGSEKEAISSLALARSSPDMARVGFNEYIKRTSYDERV